ncbi:zinc-binding dehydrogenase [Rhodococcoides fascians]|uniref:zinc-binding dehydrogenase n=1 Tax=Rhodococcoides fascians TaxID=1828 RepID=UPI00056BEA58|nr:MULTISPECIES: zinc-binding dehydrogenase [Rhodococcus]
MNTPLEFWRDGLGHCAEYFVAAMRGEINAVVDDVLPRDEAAEAHQRMDDGQVFGRIVRTL